MERSNLSLRGFGIFATLILLLDIATKYVAETFGACQHCGREVGFDRLEALPHARFCIDCKQREEDAKK